MFESLAEEDYAFMPERNIDEEFPKFGDSQSDYDEVRLIAYFQIFY